MSVFVTHSNVCVRNYLIDKWFINDPLSRSIYNLCEFIYTHLNDFSQFFCSELQILREMHNFDSCSVCEERSINEGQWCELYWREKCVSFVCVINVRDSFMYYFELKWMTERIVWFESADIVISTDPDNKAEWIKWVWRDILGKYWILVLINLNKFKINFFKFRIKFFYMFRLKFQQKLVKINP